MKKKELTLLFWYQGSVLPVRVPFGTTYEEAEEKFKTFQLEMIKKTSWEFDVDEFEIYQSGGSSQIGRDRYSKDKFEEVSIKLKENKYEMMKK